MKLWLPQPGTWKDLCSHGVPSSVLFTSSLSLMWPLPHAPRGVLFVLSNFCVLLFFPELAFLLDGLHYAWFTLKTHFSHFSPSASKALPSPMLQPKATPNSPPPCGCTVHNFPGLKYLHPLCPPWLHGSAGQVLLIAAVLRLELSTQLTPPEILTARKKLSTSGWGTTVTVTCWTSQWGKGPCRVEDEMTGSCLWGEADQGSMGSPSVKGQIDTIVDWGKHISTRVPGEICLDWFRPVWIDIYQSGLV